MSTRTNEEAPTTPRPQEYPAALAERMEQIHAIVSGLEPRFDDLQSEVAETKGMLGNHAKATAEDIRAIRVALKAHEFSIAIDSATVKEHGQAIESIRPKVERAAAVADDARASVVDEIERLGGPAREHYEQIAADAKRWREHTTSIAAAEAEATRLRRRLTAATAVAVVTGALFVGRNVGPPLVEWIVRLLTGGG